MLGYEIELPFLYRVDSASLTWRVDIQVFYQPTTNKVEKWASAKKIYRYGLVLIPLVKKLGDPSSKGDDDISLTPMC